MSENKNPNNEMSNEETPLRNEEDNNIGLQTNSSAVEKNKSELETNKSNMEIEKLEPEATASSATTVETPIKEQEAATKPLDLTTKSSTELTTKEAYFASLNAWVKHANISQNAMALFPYYLFSSYPQIFQNNITANMGLQQGYALATAGAAAQLSGGNGGATAAYLRHNHMQQQQQQQQQQPQQIPQIGLGVAGLGAAAAAGLGIGGARVNNIVILNEQMQAEIINRNGGYEHVIAPFWKRAVAELVDVLILLLLKLIVTFTIMNVFDLDLGFEFDKEVLKKSLEDDYAGFLAISSDFLAFSSDLLALEILTKVLVCFYEAIWTRQCGATPGKMLMGLRIVYMEAMLPLQPPQPPQLGFRAQRVQIRALLFPAEMPGFKRAFMRAVAKNVLMTLLFPMCFIMIFFKNNRTAYDIMTKTIVIEDNPNALLRRQA